MKTFYFSTAEAATRLAVDRKTIRRWVSTGLLSPVFYIGRRPVFDQYQIEAMEARIRREGRKGRPRSAPPVA